MNISIEVTGELLEYLDGKVKSGFFKSRSEVVRTAIREMIQKDLAEQLDQAGLTKENLKELRKEVSSGIIRKKFPELS